MMSGIKKAGLVQGSADLSHVTTLRAKPSLEEEACPFRSLTSFILICMREGERERERKREGERNRQRERGVSESEREGEREMERVRVRERAIETDE